MSAHRFGYGCLAICPLISGHIIGDPLNTFCFCAAGAAKEPSVSFCAVADDPASAVCTNGGKFVDRALETIERVRFAGSHDLERKVVIIPANLTLSHPFVSYFIFCSSAVI